MSSLTLEMRNIRKAYGPVRVLEDVGLSLVPGEVRCLAGENGSGKSTLIKILSGVVEADAGEVRMGGKPLASHPDAAIAAGLSVIYQDFSLFPNLTVSENITFLRSVASGEKLFHPFTRRKLAGEVIRRMGVNLNLDQPVELLPVASKQLVAIARALANDARVIVMDEPTTALTRSEVASLVRIIRALKQSGVAFIFVSHKMEEVFEICDSVTVLRDGRVVAEGPASVFDHNRLVESMTGRTIEGQRLHREAAPQAPAFLSVRNLARRGEYAAIDLDLFPGEIVSIVGLLGSGRTELALTLAGGLTPDSGETIIEGKPVRFATIQDAMEAGIAYLPEDRLTEGLFLSQPIRENIVVSSLTKDAKAGWLSRIGMTTRARHAVQNLRIKAPRVDAPVATLSGGNQQRVALARWMERNPRLMILNGPTVGVDVGSKREIHELLVGLSRAGMAVLVVTDDIGEAITLSDRIAVMVRGSITATFDGENVDEETLSAEVIREDVR
jgi:simple sugar transport system ATP-binding protein